MSRVAHATAEPHDGVESSTGAFSGNPLTRPSTMFMLKSQLGSAPTRRTRHEAHLDREVTILRRRRVNDEGDGMNRIRDEP